MCDRTTTAILGLVLERCHGRHRLRYANDLLPAFGKGVANVPRIYIWTECIARPLNTEPQIGRSPTSIFSLFTAVAP